MMPGAQIAASIELLESVEAAWSQGRAAPVDSMMGDYFRKRRFMGAKDKGFISRRVYAVLRQGGSLQWQVEQNGLKVSPRAMVLATLVLNEKHPFDSLDSWFSGTGYDPAPLKDAERKFIQFGSSTDLTAMPDWMRLNIPEWSYPILKNAFPDTFEEEIAALNKEAPMDLRVNTLKANRQYAKERLKSEGFDATPTPHSPWGLRLDKRGAIFATETFKKGLVEVQDEGSQLAALLVDAKPGQKVIDFCAGAGGKTLAIAAMMENKGRILAWDTSETRLEQSPKRFRRADAHNIERHLITSETDQYIKRHKDSADRVLIDAPCSGSGTWRRNPDLKWRFKPEDLEGIRVSQQSILKSASRLVKNGGKLIYVTCSLFPEENEDQVNQFLTENLHFRVVTPAEIWDKGSPLIIDNKAPFFRLTPNQHKTDGFFIAILEKTAS